MPGREPTQQGRRRHEARYETENGRVILRLGPLKMGDYRSTLPTGPNSRALTFVLLIYPLKRLRQIKEATGDQRLACG